MKLSRFDGKLLCCHKTFVVAHDGPKDYVCDGDHIRHKTFVVIRKTAKSAKVSCHTSFMVYDSVNV